MFLAFLGLSSGAIKAASLNGSWKTLCKPQKKQSEIQKISFDGTNLKYEITQFEDLNCLIPLKNTVWMMKHEVFRENPSSSFWKINLSLQGIYLRGLSSELIKTFNNEANCDFTAWKVGEFKEVSGIKCANQEYKAKGFKAYNVLSQQENKLTFSISSSSPSVIQRPKRPAKTVFYSL